MQWTCTPLPIGPCMSTLCHQPSFCLCPLPSPLTRFNWTEGLLNTCGRLRPSLSLVLWCWMLTRTRQQRFDTTWRWFKSAESYWFYKTHMCHTCCFFCRSSQSSSYIRWKQGSSPEPCEALLFLFWIGGENGLFQSHPVSFLCDFVRLQDSGSMFDQFKQKVRQNLFEKHQFWKTFW